MVRCGSAVALVTLQAVAGRPDIDRRPLGAERLQAETPARVRTLIVDDSEAVRDGLRLLLEAQPYFELVGAVADPAAALERTHAARPHVVLQDFSMPGVEPFGLIRALSACNPAPAVLVLSASCDAQSARQALDAGAVGWILKDAEPEQLFAAVLDAAGFGPAARAASAVGRGGGPPHLALVPEPEPPTALDARTVWALLRALEGDQVGLSAEELASRAVLPVTIAVRYLQRLTAREPALVAPGGGEAAQRTYVLTGAGHRELVRLERRIPAAHAAPRAIR